MEYFFSIVYLCQNAGCPSTIFKPSDAPSLPYFDDGKPLELGMKFNSATDGYITGVRFYKSEALTGTHTGHVWSAAGSMLAAAIFTNELDSGWQQVMFDTPVPVTAGTSYIVSYYSSSGQYSATNPCQVYLYQKYLMQED